MGLKCGIIGLPNVGKSTLFNALTKASIKTANFPFCTIEPNIGIVSIPDPRLDQLAEIVKPKRILPTSIEFIDIAGLVKGASKGEGLGNQFLSDIHKTEAIIHVIRCFEDDDILHVTGKVNPAKDIDVINIELALSDLDTCEHAIHRISKRAKNGDKGAKAEMEVLKKCLLQLENAKLLRLLHLSKEEKELICYLGFLTLKPTMYIANLDEGGKNDLYLDKVYSIADKDGSPVVEVCGVMTTDITELNMEELGLNHLIRTSYALLKLQTYFTVGTKEVRAWTIPIGTTALQAATKIHTDFKKGFIRAQIIAFKDFITYKGEKGSKKAGKIRSEGKDYVIKDGNVIKFLFNV